jgi:predicted O-methyltransferase YrrM
MKIPLGSAFSLLRMANLSALRFVFRPAAGLAYLRDVRAAYLARTYGPVRDIELRDLASDEKPESIFFPAAAVRPGSTPPADLAALAVLARKKKPAHVFEIGTFEGLSTVVFAKNAGPACRIATLDLPADRDVPRTKRSFEAQSVSGEYRSGRLIDAYDCGAQVERLYGDSALFDFSGHENTVDLFFVDGAHTRDYVLKDSLTALRCVRADGWVVWHDGFIPDVFAVLKKIGAHHPLFRIGGTSLVLSLRKPSPEFPWAEFS